MRDDKLLRQDIIEAAQKILRFTDKFTFDQFLADDKTRDAVIRNFEIIGEASGQLSASFLQQHSIIEWRKIKGFRNLLIHQYFGVDYIIVWDIIQNLLPQVLSHLKNSAE